MESISEGDAVVDRADALRGNDQVTDAFQRARESLVYEPKSLDLSSLSDGCDSVQTPRASDVLGISKTASGETTPVDTNHQDVIVPQPSTLSAGTGDAPQELDSYLVAPDPADIGPVVAENRAPGSKEVPRPRGNILTSVSTSGVHHVDKGTTVPTLSTPTVSLGETRDGCAIEASSEETTRMVRNEIPISSEAFERTRIISTQLEAVKSPETRVLDQSDGKPQLAPHSDSRGPDHGDETEPKDAPIPDDVSASTIVGGGNGPTNSSDVTDGGAPLCESTHVTNTIINDSASPDEAVVTSAGKGTLFQEIFTRSDGSIILSKDQARRRGAIDVSNVSVTSELPDGTVELGGPSTTESTRTAEPTTEDGAEHDAIPSEVEAQYDSKTVEHQTAVNHDQTPVPAEERPPEARRDGPESCHLGETTVSVPRTHSVSAPYLNGVTAQDHITECHESTAVASLPSNQSGESVSHAGGKPMRPMNASTLGQGSIDLK